MTPQTSAERIPLPDNYAFGVNLTWAISKSKIKTSDNFKRVFADKVGLPTSFYTGIEQPGMWPINTGGSHWDGVMRNFFYIQSPLYPQASLSGEGGLRQIQRLENEVLIPFTDPRPDPQHALSLSVPLTQGNALLETKRILGSYLRNYQYFSSQFDERKLPEITRTKLRHDIDQATSLARLQDVVDSSCFGAFKRCLIPGASVYSHYHGRFLTTASEDFLGNSQWAVPGKLTENVERLVRFAYAAKEGRPNEEVDRILTMPIVPIAPKSELILSADQVRGSLTNEVRTGGTGINPNQKQQQRDVLTF